MGRRIEHALVMDTDHLPGGGGYAVAGFSEGITDAERVFAAQNYGISDWLHDPQNARVYFSVFRVPNGRHAFVRRFSQGRRRSGVQNRLFVHTLFLDDATLEALHFLPWLLADASFSIGPLTLDVQPLLADPAFPPLELLDSFSANDAYQQLKLRFEQVERKTEGAVGAALEALSHRAPVVLPQGPPFEQLSLVAWSMLPPLDRASLGWTQHDAGNLAGVHFALSNAPHGGGQAILPVRTGEIAWPPHRRIAVVNTRSVDDWIDYQARTREYRLSITSDKLLAWLDFREANAELGADPRASRELIAARLRKLAAAVRQDHRDPWVNEQEILRFLWSMRAAGLHAGEIGAVAFREPPPREWLDEHAAHAEDVIRFVVEGTKSAAVREAIAKWVLDRRPKVSNETIVRLANLDDIGPNVRMLLEQARPAWTPAVTAGFWRQLDMKDVGSLQSATVKTVANAPKDVLDRWLSSARRLPDHPRCEELLDVLATVADLRVERAWRELMLNRGTEETLMQLDYALRHNRTEELRAAVLRVVKSRVPADRAAELIRIAAKTWPTTRRIIETDLLPQELNRIRSDDEWRRLLREPIAFHNLRRVIEKRGRP